MLIFEDHSEVSRLATASMQCPRIRTVNSSSGELIVELIVSISGIVIAFEKNDESVIMSSSSAT